MAKSANLLVDGLGHPQQVGLLLPLHWQTVALLLAAVAADASVLLAADAAELAGCEAAFVLAEHAAAALAAGVDEVLALSGHPLGAPAAGLPTMVADYAREVPSYGDHYGGPRPGPPRITVGAGAPPTLDGVGPQDRVLTCLAPSDPDGAGVLLAALAAGASLVLFRGADVAAVAADLALAERATLTAGCDVAGLTRVG